MKNILLVVKKEWRETLRDRRVLIGAFVMPMVLVFVMMTAFGNLQDVMEKRPELKIGLGEAPAGLKEALGKEVKVENSADQESAVAAVRKGTLGAYVTAQPDGQAGIYFDSSRPLSMAAASVVQRGLEEIRRSDLRLELIDAGRPAELAEPYPSARIDVSEAQAGGSLLVMLLPYLVVLWTFYSGMSAASDLVAGEKERGTLETLLASPISRTEAAVGKLISLSLLCLAGGLATLAAMLVAAPLALASEGSSPPTFGAILTLAALLVPLALLFSSVLLVVSSAAKSMREAQTYLSMVSVVVLIPAIASQFIGITGQDQAAWVTWTPILNTAVAIGQALRGQLESSLALKAALTSLAPAIVFAWMAVRMFQREGILKRS